MRSWHSGHPRWCLGRAQAITSTDGMVGTSVLGGLGGCSRDSRHFGAARVLASRSMALGEAFPSVLAAARTGADWAWAQIFRDLAGPVTGYLTTRGGNEPEDLVSETFLHVARGIHSFEGDESQFRSWVFVIAHRRLQDERRAAQSRPRTEPLLGEEAAEPTTRELVASSPEAQVLEGLSLGAVMDLLSSLGVNQRDVIMLRVVGEQSLEETAAALGKSVGSVKALQRRALEGLREKLGEETQPSRRSAR